MPHVSGGIYCSQCSRVITDFTKLSDEELIKFLGRKNNGEVCGKFYKHQLERIYFVQINKSQRSYHSLRLILAGLLTLPFSSEAQTREIQKPSVIKTGQQKTFPINTHSRIIKGKVINRASRKGISASVKLYADNSDRYLVRTVFSDSSGHYELGLPDSGLHKFFRIVYVSENYLERHVVVDRDKLTGLFVCKFTRICSRGS